MKQSEVVLNSFILLVSIKLETENSAKFEAFLALI